tara:strand:+ start:8922 stop:9359 length:438 start_codon:yes stop_codon:yes gene_type:complete
MRDVNRIELMGRVGQDPKIHTFDNGGRVAEFRMATSESWKDKKSGDWKEKTQWHTVKCFTSSGNKGLAGFVQDRVVKGMRIRVVGQLTYREYEKDGSKRTITEINVPPFWGEVDPQEKLGDAREPAPSESPDETGVPIDDDDIPF